MGKKIKWRTALMFCMLVFPALLLSACDGKGMNSPSTDDLSGKTIISLTTHGGSRLSGTLENI